MDDLEQDAQRWRALVKRAEIFKINTCDSAVIFQVAAGIDWTHNTLTDAIDAMVLDEKVIVGDGDTGEEI